MRIMDIKDLITEATDLLKCLRHIDKEDNTDESNQAVVELTAMLETDSTAYNIDNLASYVRENSDSIVARILEK